MTLARRLVEQHGGVLEGHSDGPGKGSEFVATLPTCSQTVSPAPTSERGVATKTEPCASRILVVDDEAIIALSLQVLLESMGHRVRTLNDGRETLAVIRDFHPEVVFLNIGMPDMDGCEVAASIRAATLDFQPLLVALTGYGGESDRDAAKKAGFDEFLLKPLASEKIETLLDGLG